MRRRVPAYAHPVPGSLNQSWTYSQQYIPEDEVLLAGRRRAEEVGCVPIGSGGGVEDFGVDPHPAMSVATHRTAARRSV